MRYWILCVLIYCVIVNAACSPYRKSGNVLKNKILVFSEADLNADKYYDYNSFYLDTYNDSITWVDHAWGIFEQSIDHPIEDTIESSATRTVTRTRYADALHDAYVPFKIEKNKKEVFVNYTVGGKARRHLQFTTGRDSTKTRDIPKLCDINPYEYGSAHYTNRDTTITLNNLKLRCRIFEEFFKSGMPAPDRKRIIYFEKYTWIPVLIISQFYLQDNFRTPKNDPAYRRISFILEDPTRKNHPKWRPPACIF